MEWAKSVGGISSDNGYSIAIDSEGNTYTIGHFGFTADFDPGPGVFNLTDVGVNQDVFILKLNNAGEFLWAKSIESESIIYAKKINIDSIGNIYITGHFNGAPDFDPGIGTYVVSAEENTDSYLLKLNSDGEFIWVKTYGLSYDCYAETSAIDEFGNIYTFGSFNDTLDVDPGPSESLIYSNGLNDCFIQKLNTDGEFIWAISFGGISYENAKWLTIDSEGNVYTAGSFNFTVDFDPGPSEYNIIASDPHENFIQKLNSDGEFLWAGSLPATESSSINCIAADQVGNIYLAGRYRGTMDFDPSAGVNEITSSAYFGGAFIDKITSDGEFLWTKTWDKPETWSVIEEIKAINNVDIYIVGEISNSGDLDPGVTTHYISPSGDARCFVEKLDSCGKFKWAKTFVSIADYAGYGNSMQSLQIDTTGDIFCTGYYKGSLGFDPVYEIDTLNVFEGNFSDVLISKISPCEMEYGDTLNIFYCELDSFYWESNNLYLNESGVYSHSLVNIYGCDSMVYLDLYLNESYLNSTDTAVCFAFEFPSSDSIVYESGTYNDTLTSIYGCDSVLIYHVSVNNSFSELIITVCDSFITPSGLILEESGVYSDTIPNYLGCDSIISIELDLGHTFAELILTACDSFITPSGLILDESGVYSDTIPNYLGCDSIISIELDLGHSFYDSSEVTACIKYFWEVNDEFHLSSGIYEEFYLTAEGCDSIYYLNLIINELDIDVTQSEITLTAVIPDLAYQWLDCENDYTEIPGQTSQVFVAESNGSYAVQLFDGECIDTSECFLISELNNDEYHSIKHDIFIYPNPTSGIIHVELGAYYEHVEIKLFNVLGELMLREFVEYGNSATLNTSFSPGIYSIEIWHHGSLSNAAKVVLE